MIIKICRTVSRSSQPSVNPLEPEIMLLEHQDHCINISPLDTAASSHHVCLLWCLETKEGGEKQSRRVGKKTNKQKIKEKCRKRPGERDRGRHGTAGSWKHGEEWNGNVENEWNRGDSEAQSSQELIYLTPLPWGMASVIYDECVGWLRNHLTVIHPKHHEQQSEGKADGSPFPSA